MKIFISLCVVFCFLCFHTSRAYARSGCCSWHGGVCGCSCCDGAPLSSTCAPYYPSCGSTRTVPVPKTPSCGANSYYNSADGKCYCNAGYCTNTSKSGCVRLPNNAHCINSTADAWLCDAGYKESGSSCVKIPVLTETTTKDPATTNTTRPVATTSFSQNSSSEGNETALTLFGAGAVGLASYIYNKRKKG